MVPSLQCDELLVASRNGNAPSGQRASLPTVGVQVAPTLILDEGPPLLRRTPRSILRKGSTLVDIIQQAVDQMFAVPCAAAIGTRYRTLYTDGLERENS